MFSTCIPTIHPLNRSPQNIIKFIRSECSEHPTCKGFEMHMFLIDTQSSPKYTFSEFFQLHDPWEHTFVSTHIFLTINCIINNISTGRHCCQLEVFFIKMFESWMGLENHIMELIYIVRELRGNQCSSLFLLLCDKILRPL